MKGGQENRECAKDPKKGGGGEFCQETFNKGGVSVTKGGPPETLEKDIIRRKRYREPKWLGKTDLASRALVKKEGGCGDGSSSSNGKSCARSVCFRVNCDLVGLGCRMGDVGNQGKEARRFI